MSEARERMDEAIQGAWRVPDEDPPGMVTKWVLAVETIDENGERYLLSMRSPDTFSWDAKGMLYSILDDLTAIDVADVLTED